VQRADRAARGGVAAVVTDPRARRLRAAVGFLSLEAPDAAWHDWTLTDESPR